MKRLIVTLVLAGVMVGISSCAFKEEKTPADETQQTAQTVVTDAVKDDRELFQPLPDDANGAFNTVINTVKKIIPPDSGCNRQYGYKGIDKVDGVDCYIFSAYDFDKDNSSVKVGDFAKAVDKDVVYKLTASGYEELEPVTETVTLTLTKKGDTSKKMLNNAATLAAEKVIEG